MQRRRVEKVGVKGLTMAEKGSTEEKSDFSEAVYGEDFNYQSLRGKPSRPKRQQEQRLLLVDMPHRISILLPLYLQNISCRHGT